MFLKYRRKATYAGVRSSPSPASSAASSYLHRASYAGGRGERKKHFLSGFFTGFRNNFNFIPRFFAPVLGGLLLRQEALLPLLLILEKRTKMAGAEKQKYYWGNGISGEKTEISPSPRATVSEIVINMRLKCPICPRPKKSDSPLKKGKLKLGFKQSSSRRKES